MVEGGFEIPVTDLFSQRLDNITLEETELPGSDWIGRESRLATDPGEKCGLVPWVSGMQDARLILMPDLADIREGVLCFEKHWHKDVESDNGL